VGRFIASACILTVTFFVVCIEMVFAASERLIRPEAKLRRLKSDTPRRVVEIVARTLGVGLAIFLVVYLVNYGLDAREILSGKWPADDFWKADRSNLYSGRMGELSKHYNSAARWLNCKLFSFLSSARSFRAKLQVSYSPSVQNYSLDRGDPLDWCCPNA
jgi:hypothetical protein